MPGPIENYALIGDCETAALVGQDGSIDWLCWPRFDSDACFAALLGTEDHGRWRLVPRGGLRKTSRSYVDDTLILETRFETDTGVVRLVDFMPPRGEVSELVRLVVGESGTVDMRGELVLRFGYGADVPWVTRLDGGILRAVAGPDMAVLRTSVPLRGENLKTISDFTVKAGDRVPFVLAYGPSHRPPPPPIDPERALKETEDFWTNWVDKAECSGPWAEAVRRSLITLKALTYAPTGGIIAAATTSLPEQIGGIRNWDYRFCWLRDSTLTLLALMNAGIYDEARDWRDWLMRAVAGAPSQAQIMYGIAGERRLSEWQVGWLPGYEGSRPVRIGNAAHGQLQLDVYGEVIDTLYQGLKGGLPRMDESWALQRALLDHLEKIWRDPDRGIWEMRGEPRHFTFSKVMAWVAFDRAVKMSGEFELDGTVDQWSRLRDAIHADICAKAYNPKLGSFVESYGSEKLDASLLLIPTTGFLPIDDARVAGTVAMVEKRLMVDGFVMRHDPAETETGLAKGEGAFLACSFWLADAYSLLGRHEDAERLLERLMGLRNDVGLLAEEYEPLAKRQLGNFPQAFSHVALINTVHNLSRAAKPAVQRARRNGQAGAAAPDAATAKPQAR
jgi:GH15 family glucan-1,4-alpha-glucosidase